ncbi:VCBS repeat-containing protein [Seonamhaeicola maritimus]|uniref:VCBS repeat-containing protein n=1 Tax=Seonamhaeicola maritimus TaxID=2591822 RepID=A0A5C7GHM3_9FLAO|nr:VCBS repeat-containing protein [Seonamhaeicola maritimus]TXG37136.1 VCBS repeat-containing protein [Seonamhaeicola maritimus]
MLSSSIFSFRSRPFFFTVISLLFLHIVSCKKDVEQTQETTTLEDKQPKLFTTINSSESGIDFINTLEETLESNYFQYLYTYIGGGVAAGDINNDGLIDLYFTSNQDEDKLYLNKGSFKFQDITESAGIKNIKGFNTGVTMADVNNDGFLDIYVSRGGWQDDDNKFANLLYINNGNNTFTEKAKELGLDDDSRTIHATFFDYDNDNDLDLYVSNSPDIEGKSKVQDLRPTYKDAKNLELKGCDKLFRNDGTGHFTDVSRKAKLQFDLGFGLNPQVGDLNNDGWQDIYVCNDFDYPDLVYINNGDGTFTESRNEMFKHISYNSMGSDFTDINNDGYFDLMTLDMNPEDYVRSKTTMSMTSVSQFEQMVDNDYHYQYMHNMLQLNNGNGTFSEISKMSGVADTDWSWSILSADFDLDGFNDMYITNGVFRDVLDRDVHNETLRILRENGRKPTDEDFLRFSKMMPQQKLTNYFYKNNGDLTFENTSNNWVDSSPTFSNGATYADLDNDGDLDIVVNNINDEATILKNNAIEFNSGNYLKIDLNGPDKNKNGLGSTITLEQVDGNIQTRQLTNTKGFLSSVSNIVHFGLAKDNAIKQVTIKWLDGKTQTLQNVKPNALLSISYADAALKEDTAPTSKSKPLLTKLKSSYKHTDPYFNDYDLQVLLPHKLSQLGPALAKSDVNNDGIEDIFIGGANGQPGKLLLGNSGGTFNIKKNESFIADKRYEDVGAAFLDADGDGDEDLYVSHGSYEYYGYPSALQDILYLNDGSGIFTKKFDALPEIKSAGSSVAPFDYDNDGDIDLFVGGRVIPGKYPQPPLSYLLVNENGVFNDKTDELGAELKNIGLVTDAVWSDINGDNKVDLIVTGEWLGVDVFINQDNKLVKNKAYEELSSHVGWWNRLLATDFDNDGDIDIIAGNLGLNYKFHASPEKPFQIYSTDFDFNGTEDVILAKEYNGEEVPIRGKTCMTQQIPHLAQKIPNYNEFASKNLEGILGKRLGVALNYKATEFRSGIFVNNGEKGFEFMPFSNSVQASPINSILSYDLNNDGNDDLILAGNNYQSEVETTKADAGTGHVLLSDGKGNYTYLTHQESGFFADKDVRNMVLVNGKNNKYIFIANNNDYQDLFTISK